MAFFAGILIGLVVLLTINTISAKQKKKDKIKRYKNITDPIDVPVATIAKDLGPLFEKYISDGTKIDIVGDGYYAYSTNEKIWMKCLRGWLSRGISISYILIEADKAALSALHPLMAEYGDKFLVYELRKTHADEKIGKIADLFFTMHPVLISTDLGQGMWLEKYHPRHSCHAYNNRFVPPGKLADGDLDMHTKFKEYLEYAKRIVAPLRVDATDSIDVLRNVA
ncbi:hypothetical protein [Hoeflea poritis]|uniref:Uncharacterized protein n=1 Tax=Hoeflea poritis TaxID=2993659 RepID=A0ABT4VJ73_9HYPH|nr:hypothetical protein [Hoeflea poritis]MDA4844752.1 hypothetical protein [Hoeflea poritis]